MIVKPDTDVGIIEDNFRSLTNRNDIGIVLINQHIANDIRHLIRDYNKTVPTILGNCLLLSHYHLFNITSFLCYVLFRNSIQRPTV